MEARRRPRRASDWAMLAAASTLVATWSGRDTAAVQQSSGESPPQHQALLVTIAETCHALSCKKSKVYALLNEGELRSVGARGARRVEYASILEYISRRDGRRKGMRQR